MADDALEPDGTEAVEEVERVEVLEAEHDGPIDSFPPAAKKLLGNAEMIGWTTHNVRSLVHHDDTFVKSGDNAGNLKKAAHNVEHFWVSARADRYPLGFVASWKREVKEKPSNVFQYARVLDPVGQPVELYFDYSPASSDLRQKKDEPEWAHERRVRETRSHAERQDQDYNDGLSHLEKDYIINGKKDFDAWLSGWVEMLTEGAAA